MLAWLLDFRFEEAWAAGHPIDPAMVGTARQIYARMGDRRGVLTQLSNQVAALALVEAFDEIDALIDREGRDGQIPALFLRMVEGFRDAVSGKMEAVEAYVAAHPPGENPRSAGAARAAFADALLAADRVDDALAQIDVAMPLLRDTPSFQALAHAVLARARLRRGDVAGACAAAEQAVALSARGVAAFAAALPALAHAEALDAAGRPDEARAALREGVAPYAPAPHASRATRPRTSRAATTERCSNSRRGTGSSEPRASRSGPLC